MTQETFDKKLQIVNDTTAMLQELGLEVLEVSDLNEHLLDIKLNNAIIRIEFVASIDHDGFERKWPKYYYMTYQEMNGKYIHGPTNTMPVLRTIITTVNKKLAYIA